MGSKKLENCRQKVNDLLPFGGSMFRCFRVICCFLLTAAAREETLKNHEKPLAFSKEYASAPCCAQRTKEDEQKEESSKSWSETAPKNKRRKNNSRVRKFTQKVPKKLQHGSPEGGFWSSEASWEALGHQVGPRRLPKVAWGARNAMQRGCCSRGPR